MMMGALCPGQGSQTVGMGRDLINRYPEIDQMLREAGDFVNTDLIRVVKKGPSRHLQSTGIAQVAIFVFSAGIHRVLSRLAVSFDCAAGHSVGEISALHLAGAVEYQAALKLVIARAAAMEHAASLQNGGMAAVMASNLTEIEQVAKANNVAVANLNAPNQTVISGDMQDLARAENALKTKGIRFRRLQVGGAFHSPLMEPALDLFDEALADCTFSQPKIPVVSNVTGALLMESSDLRSELRQQICAPVQWRSCLDALVDLGAEEFVEVGFGKHMKGLVRLNHPEHACFLTSTSKEIDILRTRQSDSLRCAS